MVTIRDRRGRELEQATQPTTLERGMMLAREVAAEQRRAG
jgi:hypothetical protein